MAKPFVTLAVVCAVGVVLMVEGFDIEADIAAFKVQLEDCKTQVGAKDTDIEELLLKKPASSMEGKCLRSCLMKKYELMGSNGKFVKSVAITHAEKYANGAVDKMKIAHDIIDACADIDVPNDHCEAAEQYGKCFKEFIASRIRTSFTAEKNLPKI